MNLPISLHLNQAEIAFILAIRWGNEWGGETDWVTLPSNIDTRLAPRLVATGLLEKHPSDKRAHRRDFRVAPGAAAALSEWIRANQRVVMMAAFITAMKDATYVRLA